MSSRPLAVRLLAGIVLLASTWATSAAGESAKDGESPLPVWEDAVPAPPPLDERLAEIRRRIRDAVVYPERSRQRGVTGVAHIRFAIGNDGIAEEVETVRTSGHAVLDRAAEQGARDAGRLPYVYGRVEMPIRFALEGRVR